MKKFAKTLVLALLFFLSQQTVNAETIDRFKGAITINPDGTVRVEELITYNFGTDSRHGIIRKIPIIKDNVDGEKYKMDFFDISTGNDPHQITKTSNELQIKIGDPNIKITDTKVYQITYTVSGALSYFIDHDELYWNLTGVDNDVIIKKAYTTVHYPQDIPREDIEIVCYTGKKGSSEQSCSTRVRETESYVTTTQISEPREGLSFAIKFPKGFVEVIEPQKDKVSIYTIIILGIMGVVALFWYVIVPIKTLRNGLKNYKFTKTHQKIVSAWFQPPEYDNGFKFTPAETSSIVNVGTDNNAITATIIQLAQKGFLQIILDKKNKASLVKKSMGTTGLAKFEKDLLAALFEKRSEVKLDSLAKSQKFYNTIQDFKKDVLKQLHEKKMFDENPKSHVDKNIGVAIAAGITGNIFLLLIKIFLGKKTVKRSLIGIQKYSEAVSLKNFLVSQDEQLDFQAENQMFFEKLLPYASAFGVEDVWIKRFEHLKFDKSDWFDGDLNNVAAFSSIPRSINKSVSKAYHAGYSSGRTSSSGFSSGFSGGSSGGGGGGGSTGSW